MTQKSCLKIAVILLLVVLLVGTGIFVRRERLAISHTLFLWTGETEFPQQIKGMTDLTADMLRPKPKTEDLTPVRYADVNPFGVNTFLEQEADPAKRERTVRMIADAGFHWIRQEFPWEDIEISGKGDFWDHKWNHSAWDKYDQIVDLAHKYHLGIIVRLSNPPAWSRAGGNSVGTYAPPDDFDDFGDFVATVVARYKGRVRYYQIWNEPNIYPEWGNRPVSPEEYTRLLCTAYHRAKEVDPNVVIIAGALASTIELGPRNMNDFIFLQRMYDAGARKCFDIMAMQGYGLWSGPTDRRMYPMITNFSRPRYIRDIMVKNGDASKAIWISEMNWDAVPDSVPDKRFGQVTPEQQARYVPMAYERIQRNWPWIGVVNLWYFKRATDQWEREQKPEAYFRMVAPDFTPQPVYRSMKEYMHRQPVVYYGHHQETHWALRWEGDWRRESVKGAEFGKAQVVGNAGGSLNFVFEGHGLAFRILRASRVSVTVDGKARDLPVPGNGFLRVTNGLPGGRHRAALKLAQPGAAVDAVIVYR